MLEKIWFILVGLTLHLLSALHVSLDSYTGYYRMGVQRLNEDLQKSLTYIKGLQ